MTKRKGPDQFPVPSRHNALPSGFTARGLDAIIAAVQKELRDPKILRKGNELWDQWDEFDQRRSVIMTEFLRPMRYAGLSRHDEYKYLNAVSSAAEKAKQYRDKNLSLEDLIKKLYRLVTQELSRA